MDINRILIVGLGSIGRRHLRLAREQFPNATIKVLRHSISHELCEEADGSFSTLVEAIAFQPQLAVIAGPATFHLDTALPLAEAGVNLLVEKPISASISGVAQLIKAVEKQGSTLLTGYNLRFLPSLQFFRAKLDDGLIGKFLSVRCEMGQYLPSWRPDSNYRTGVSARAELGGGVLLELSHELDFLRWIFGEIEWIKATLSRQSALDIDVEDAAHLTLGFAPDAGGCQLIGSVNLDFFRHDTTRLCTVIGEKGSLQWNGITGEVMFYKSCAKCAPMHTTWTSESIQEIKRVQSVPLVIGQFSEMVDNNRGIVSSTAGQSRGWPVLNSDMNNTTRSDKLPDVLLGAGKSLE